MRPTGNREHPNIGGTELHRLGKQILCAAIVLTELLRLLRFIRHDRTRQRETALPCEECRTIRRTAGHQQIGVLLSARHPGNITLKESGKDVLTQQRVDREARVGDRRLGRLGRNRC